jgi:predicted nucleic acid-binding protein
MRLLLDTSVWVEHLRHDALRDVVPRLRGKLVLWCHAVTGAELRAGCRGKRERDTVGRLLSPFEKAGRVLVPDDGDYQRAGAALSRLREGGKTLRQPGGALLDALIAATAARHGALVVTQNLADFRLLATVLPVRVESLPDLVSRL